MSYIANRIAVLVALAGTTPALADEPQTTPSTESSASADATGADAVQVATPTTALSAARVEIDPVTGLPMPASAAKAAKLDKAMAAQFSGIGPKGKTLDPVTAKDGTVSAVLPLTQLSYAFAHIGSDGQLHAQCTHGHGAETPDSRPVE